MLLIELSLGGGHHPQRTLNPVKLGGAGVVGAVGDRVGEFEAEVAGERGGPGRSPFASSPVFRPSAVCAIHHET